MYYDTVDCMQYGRVEGHYCQREAESYAGDGTGKQVMT